jgi:hypothetical protein
MKRHRKHRRRKNPVDPKTLMYVGGGLAVAGVLWILYQNSQNQVVVTAPPASTGTTNAGAVVSALTPYAQCIANGGNVISCLGQPNS